MKVTLTYDFDNVDGRLDYLKAVNSIKMASILFEIQFNLHKKCLWELEQLQEADASDGIDLVFSKIYNLIEEQNLKIEEFS